jgi:hypothetical protein
VALTRDLTGIDHNATAALRSRTSARLAS